MAKLSQRERRQQRRQRERPQFRQVGEADMVVLENPIADGSLIVETLRGSIPEDAELDSDLAELFTPGSIRVVHANPSLPQSSSRPQSFNLMNFVRDGLQGYTVPAHVVNREAFMDHITQDLIVHFINGLGAVAPGNPPLPDCTRGQTWVWIMLEAVSARELFDWIMAIYHNLWNREPDFKKPGGEQEFLRLIRQGVQIIERRSEHISLERFGIWAELQEQARQAAGGPDPDRHAGFVLPGPGL